MINESQIFNSENLQIIQNIFSQFFMENQSMWNLELTPNYTIE